MAQDSTGTTKRPVEGDVEHGVPLVVGHVDQQRRSTQTGVVDHHVDTTETIHRGPDQGLNVVLVGDVADLGERTSTGLGVQAVCGLLKASLVEVRDEHRGTLLYGSPGHGRADAGSGRGGDNDGLAREQAVTGNVGGNSGHGHPFGAGLGSPGSPSARSPMMLRWISLEPA